jgi:Cd2+/Zn2+-exporting ATPase
MVEASSNTCIYDSGCDCVEPFNSSYKKLGKPARMALAAAGVLFFLAALIFAPGGYLQFMLYGAAYLIFGGGVLLRAARNIARGKVFDENFLMAIATLGAFAIGEYPEGVAVMVFYQLGEALQDGAVDRSRRSIKALMDIRPDYANLKDGDQLVKVSPEQVQTGAVILVRPGERVPLDGVVTEGDSTLDLSALTGESLPGEVSVGSEVLSGSVNITGLLSIEVTRAYKDSTVSRILALVENASARKARTEQFITRFAAYYTPAVVAAALLIALVPPLFIAGQGFSTWAYRALIFLVISCPCALVISIPLGFFGGIGGASKRGILVKGGNYLEALSQVDTVIFDKTGTLTHGFFTVSKINPLNGYSEDDLLRFGAAAAYYSHHPLAASILKAWPGKIDENMLHGYKETPGYGIRVQHGDQVILMGNGKLMKQHEVPFAEDNGEMTQVHIALAGVHVGSISVSDEPKEDAQLAVKRLRALGVNTLVLLTGDKKPVAEALGSKLGFDQVYAELLPDQKLEMIEKLERENKTGKKHVFVGDGINDAPSLARAQIGVAMGGVASDAAIEAADIVLMTGQPTKLAEAIGVARKTRTIVIQNIVLALGVKGVIMAFGLFGLASMWEAVFADVGVALLAVLNAMRAMK